jgi:alpha-1,3/alpha-1,6-mannosyltransferase
MGRSLRIAFIHPDLGIGGAERLVIDAAAGLQQAGHRVTIFASHCDRDRCFEEARDGSLEVRIFGDFIPLQIGQRMRAPLAIARMCFVAGRIGLSGEKFDVIFADLVAQSIPLLRLLTAAKLIFYCHFPDRLLAPKRDGLYRWYRAPIDWAEEAAIGMADLLLVNSRFTASIVRGVFPRVDPSRIQVLYPGVELSRYTQAACDAATGAGKVTILSISRYERKKNVAMAIEVLALLRRDLSSEVYSTVELIVAGGFDERLRENRETLAELSDLARRRSVENQVTFLRNPSDLEVRGLLSQSRCILYTSENEHFGYVPVEAMAAGRPVIAVNNGGPSETVVDGVTGFLCAPKPEAFAAALMSLVRDPGLADRMGRAAREHVAKHFSRVAFSEHLGRIVEDLVGDRVGA